MKRFFSPMFTRFVSLKRSAAASPKRQVRLSLECLEMREVMDAGFTDTGAGSIDPISYNPAVAAAPESTVTWGSTGIAGHAASGTEIDLSWSTGFVLANGQPGNPTGTDVCYFDGSKWMKFEQVFTNTCVLTGLTPGATYKFEIGDHISLQFNQDGTESYSEPVIVTMPGGSTGTSGTSGTTSGTGGSTGGGGGGGGSTTSTYINSRAFILQTNGNVLERDANTGNLQGIAGGVTYLSAIGTDTGGGAMVDLISNGNLYEHGDTTGWTLLATSASSGKPGVGVSEVLVGTTLYEWNDSTHQWRTVALNVNSYSVGTDLSGRTEIGIVQSSGNAFAYSDTTGQWTNLASNVSQISVGQNGYVSIIQNGSLFVHSDASNTWTTLASNAAVAYLGTDSSGGPMEAVILTNGAYYIHSATGWITVNGVNSITKPDRGVVGVVGSTTGTSSLFDTDTSAFSGIALDSQLIVA